MVDDAVVERVAGDADARMRQRRGPQASLLPGESHDREIARPAAEIGDEHGLVALDVPRVPIGGAERLVGEFDIGHAGVRIGRAKPEDGEIFVGHLPRENDGSSGDDRVCCRHGTSEEFGQEGRDQRLDREALAVEARLGKRAAREMGLERLDEAMIADRRFGLGDRRRPRDMGDGSALAPEGQRGPEGRGLARRCRPAPALHMPVGKGQRDDAVRRAEVDPDAGDRGHEVSKIESPRRRRGQAAPL